MIVGGATLDLVGCTSVPLLHLYMYVRLYVRLPARARAAQKGGTDETARDTGALCKGERKLRS